MVKLSFLVEKEKKLAEIVEEEVLVLEQTGLRWVIWLSVMSQARQKRQFALRASFCIRSKVKLRYWIVED